MDLSEWIEKYKRVDVQAPAEYPPNFIFFKLYFPN